MAKIAVLSDIHANLPAFAAVLHDIVKNGIPISDIVIAGDFVGYGPYPVEVTDIVRHMAGDLEYLPEHLRSWLPKEYPITVDKSEAAKVIKGNHEEGVIQKRESPHMSLGVCGISQKAEEAIVWTIDQLKKDLLKGSKELGLVQRIVDSKNVMRNNRISPELFEKELIERERELAAGRFQFIKNLDLDLELRVGDKNIYFAHTNPLNPSGLNDYVLDEIIAEDLGRERYTHVRELFASDKLRKYDILCYAHSHVPIIHIGNESGVRRLKKAKLKLSKKNEEFSDTDRAALNIGTVGKPRQKIKYATDTIIDTESDTLIETRRVDYGWQTTKLQSERAGLPTLYK